MADKLPGDGFLGWLGRQIGYVKSAVRTDPQPGGQSPTHRPAASRANAQSKAKSAADAAEPAVIYREGRVEEAKHPQNPELRLRRTVIDEVIHEPPATDSQDSK